MRQHLPSSRMLWVFLLWMVLVAFLALPRGSMARVYAQPGDVQRIVVMKTSVDRFPEYEIWVRLLDAYGYPVGQITPDDLALKEEDQELDFQMQATQSPVQMIFVLDAGAGIRALHQGRERATWMKEIIRGIVDKAAPQDLFGLIVVTPGGTQVLQTLTQDRDALLKQLQEWRPRNEMDFSAGLTGVEQAIAEIARVKAPYPAFVVLFTSGIQIGNQNEPRVLDLARQNDVVVYAFNLRIRGLGYSQLVEGTRGKILAVENWMKLVDDLQGWRASYYIKARSRSAQQQRTLRLEIRQRPEIGASWTVSLPRPVQPPALTVEVNNGQEYLLLTPEGEGYSPETAPVVLQASWPDGYPRILKRVELYVDDELYQARDDVAPTQSVTFQWKVAPEEGTHTFVVRVVDELGLQSEVRKNLTVQIQTAAVVQPDLFCRNVVKIPRIGPAVQEFICGTLGFGLAEILISVLLAAVLIVGIRKREYVKEVAVQVTEAVARVTKTFGRRKAKARLVLVAGQDEDTALPESIDLYGETTIGRDPKYADIVLNRPSISRLHCAIHEDLETGRWTIEDKESTNGTYLNGQRLEPLRPYPLKTGDVIEIAPLYRGGVQFRFEALEEEPVSEVLHTETWDDSMIEADGVDVTQEVTQDVLDEGEEDGQDIQGMGVWNDAFDDLLAEDDQADTEEDEFDPSQANF